MQCSKLLWIAVNDKARIPKPDKETQHKFDAGHEVGILATMVFPGGIDLAELGFKENIDKTRESLELRRPIFEAGFLADNLFSRADILLPVGTDEWDIIEVKMATKVKDSNVHDVAFQKYVYEKVGLKIRRSILMHLDNSYLKKGEINPKDIFVQADITDEVASAMIGIEDRISKMFEVINLKECPEFNVDDLATIEYSNIAKDEFMGSLPEGNVFELSRGGVKSRNLYKDGIVKIKDIPDPQKLTSNQEIQKECSISNKPHIDEKSIKKFLDGLEYPLYYLDFEAMTPTLPKFDYMKVYQHIPFQYSLHIVEKPGAKPKHISFLADGVSNPIPKFMQSLKDNLGETGDIIVYNQTYEKSKMKESATLFPEFEKLVEDNFTPRIKDLWDPFRKFNYYDPRQKGSASIKAVLPVMSDLSYDELVVNNGMDASLEFERITFGNVPEKEKDRVREALEKYCKMDTMAEVKIVERLYELVNNKREKK